MQHQVEEKDTVIRSLKNVKMNSEMEILKADSSRVQSVEAKIVQLMDKKHKLQDRVASFQSKEGTLTIAIEKSHALSGVGKACQCCKRKCSGLRIVLED